MRLEKFESSKHLSDQVALIFLMNELNPMNAPSSSESDSVLKRLLKRCHAPKLLFAAVCLGTLVVLGLALENRLRSNPNGASSPKNSSPERIAAKQLVSATVPDDQNFAAVPYFQQLFEKGSPTASDSRWPDDFSRADRWPRRIPTFAESPRGRLTGRFMTDLVAWKTCFERSQDVSGSSSTQEEIPVREEVSPADNAAAAAVVLEALKPYEPVLEELQAARSRPYARFPVHYDWEHPWGILLPHLSVIKRTSQLLRLKASAELAAGHGEQAMQDVLLLLRLADAPKDEPFLISQLVRVACLEITMQPLWEGLATHRWSEPQLQSLQRALESFDFLADLKRVFEAERTLGSLTIALLREQRTPNLSRYLLSSEDSKGPEPWIVDADHAFESCPREWFDAEQRNYDQLFHELLIPGFDPVARRTFPKISEENAHRLTKTLGHQETLLEKHMVFAKLLLIPSSKVQLKLAGAQGTADLANLACALERHRLRAGQYPQQLSELVPQSIQQMPHDVISGEPLHYERTKDGLFLLYSIGWNENDDGGQPGFFASGRGPEKKEGDWVWRYPAGAAVHFE